MDLWIQFFSGDPYPGENLYSSSDQLETTIAVTTEQHSASSIEPAKILPILHHGYWVGSVIRMI